MRSNFLLLLFFLLSTGSFAQQLDTDDSQLKQTLQHLENYQKEYPQEKVYLHLDKSYYVAGEDIWFKAYITVGQFNFLSAISNIVYVELIDGQDKIVLSRRLLAISGLAVGDFQLPDTLREGSYRIRAYTNWMRNFDDGLFFDRTLLIGNSLSNGLIVSSNFTYAADDKNRKMLRATMLIEDLEGNLLTNKPVNYEIRWGGKRVSKGKTQLDEEGSLQLEYVLKEEDATSDGSILLSIDNAEKVPVTKEIPIQKELVSPTIELYPEGGVLVADVFNKIAFRAVGGQGKGRHVTGFIESNGEKIITFASDHAGIGAFSISPEASKTYKVVMLFDDGQTSETQLPPVTTNGYTMAVNNAIENAVWIQIAASTNLVDDKIVSIIAQNNGEIFYAAKSKLNKEQVTMSIPRKNLPSGIVRLLLVDQEMKLLAQRSVFNWNQSDLINLETATNKKNYGRREKVDLTVKASELDDSLLLGNFSIAITNMSKAPDSVKKVDNILSTLLLTANSRQYIEEPGYYFQEYRRSMDLHRELDNLMLTQQGDSSFWSQMKKGVYPSKSYLAEKEMQISGVVTKRNGDPVDQAKVTVISPQHITAVLDTVTGDDGRFSFGKLVFYDSTNFVIQARDAKGKKNVEIKMDDLGKQKVSPNKNAPDEIIDANEWLGDYLKLSNRSLTELQKFGLLQRSILLDEVEVTAKKENPAKYSANLNGPGNADQVINGDEQFLSGCPTLDMCLNGRLVGVLFRNGVPYSTRSPNIPMQVVLDGMYMDASALSVIPPFDVASIEVLRNAGNTAIYGSFGAGGVLIITTRRGDQPRKYSAELYTPGIVTYHPQGLYEARLFRSPDYSLEEEKPGMKDLRSTIYWNPNIFTDKNGESHLSFYTADEPGVYQIVIEGIDMQGHLGRSVSYIHVE